MGIRLPDHCCCCGLRSGAIVIGGFVLAVCFPLMVVLGRRSTDLRDVERGTELKDAYHLARALFWLSAALNGVEVLMTLAMFWGLYKRKEKWVTRWLFVSVGWWMHHSVLSLALLSSSSRPRDLALASFVGPFLFFLGYMCLKTVAGLRAEMLSEGDAGPSEVVTDRPADDASASASAGAGADDNVQL